MSRHLSALVILLAIVGCERSIGPGDSEDYDDEGTFIRVGNVSLALYDGLGRIIVNDRRISPTSYRGICLRVSLDDQNYTSFYKPPNNFEVEIKPGGLAIHDPDHSLISYRDQLKRSSIEKDGVTTEVDPILWTAWQPD